jgi:hypothetical protein
MARGERAKKGASEAAAVTAAAPADATSPSDAAAEADAAEATSAGGKGGAARRGVPGWVGGLVWLAGASATFALQDWLRNREVKRLEAEEARVRAATTSLCAPAARYAGRRR